MMNEKPQSRARFPRGSQTPIFTDHTDTLIGMITALLGEVVVLRERVDAHERLAQKAGVYSVAEVDSFVPDESVAAERTQLRDKTIRRVMHAVHKELAVERQTEADIDLVEAVQKGNL